MLTRAVFVPTAPLFLRRVTPELPESLVALRGAVEDALAEADDAAAIVLVGSDEKPGVYGGAHADLRGLGRADVDGNLPVDPRGALAVAAATGLDRIRGILPLDLAVLTLHLRRPVVPVAVAPGTPADDLVAIGRNIAEGLEVTGRDMALVAAADGSAGLSDRSPRPAASGAVEWQAAFEGALGDPEALAAIGPAGAADAAARGWAPALVGAAASAAAQLDVRVVASDAPRGVGYVVARASASA